MYRSIVKSNMAVLFPHDLWFFLRSHNYSTQETIALLRFSKKYRLSSTYLTHKFPVCNFRYFQWNYLFVTTNSAASVYFPVM